MAITPLIEKAVLNGYGTLTNYSVGGSGMSKIEVPTGHFAIITDFEYYPFINNIFGLDGDIINDILGLTFQEINFNINGKMKKWTFKVPFVVNQWSAGQHIPTTNATFKVDTCIYADTSFYVIFKTPQILNGGTVSDFSTLTNSQSPPTPESFGNTENTIKAITNFFGERYYFPSFAEASANTSGSLTINATNKSELFPYQIGTPINNVQLPLINLQMLLVPEQNRNFLNNS